MSEIKRIGANLPGYMYDSIAGDYVLHADHTRAIHDLEVQVAVLESFRPHWAQGYSSDSMAAQGSTSALAQIWTTLCVDNQTAAMQKLRALLAKHGGHP